MVVLDESGLLYLSVFVYDSHKQPCAGDRQRGGSVAIGKVP
jgi:hypothetical protein